ncbi:MAG TPA: acetyl-CoA carboxylase biotin carboxyl carrier protein [Caulobacteraceae bacterium]
MPTPKAPAPFDARVVRELAGILNETGLSEIEVARGDLKIRVAKTLSGPSIFTGSAPSPIAHSAAGAAAAAAATAIATGSEAIRPGEMIKSPMVGTVYLQPQPGAEPFVKIGDAVAAGQTLLLVEAMKTMNPITAPRAGRILELLVGDSQPVEFGEPLVVIE